MVRRFLVMLCLFVFTSQVFAAHDKERANDNSKTSVREYIKKWGPVARTHMLNFRIPASIILAQGILESGYGNSRMAKQANNHFGIKCLGWNGAQYFQVNSEKECYRKYSDTEDSYRDHARIISNKPRYAFLFKLNIKDYKSWAWGLKKAGYAEDKQYANLLIKTIENYKLYVYDQVAVGVSAAIGKISYNIVAESTGVPKINTASIRKVIFSKPVAVKKIQKDMKPIEVPVSPVSLASLEDDTRNIIQPATPNYWITPVDNKLADQKLALPRTDVKYVIGTKYDTYSGIAREHNLTLEKLLEYNDLDSDDSLVRENQIIYLAPKKDAATDYVYTLRRGQSLWEVSQLYGVKLKKLCRLNNIRPGEDLPSGAIIKLR